MSDKEVLEKAIQKAIDVYDIQTNGFIERKDNGKPIFGSVNHTGYRYVSIYLPEIKKSKKVTVHRLVALKYIPNPDNLPQVNHIDGNRMNNQLDNLEWCTAQYNVSDGFKRGRIIWNKDNMSKERIMYIAEKYPRQVFWYLTTNDFAAAKALWGEKTYKELSVNDGMTETEIRKEVKRFNNQPTNSLDWKFHLQNMVIEEDPIKYLGENI